MKFDNNTSSVRAAVVGRSARIEKEYAIALGYQAQSLNMESISIVKMAHTSRLRSIAIGSEYHGEKQKNNYTTAEGDYSIVIGSLLQVGSDK
ncbi:hypothetical protein [Bartonella koehlerae]|uniref:Trimeric autotransporter adhesin YadA-like head domain-containing protein n=1 Tax=Bartonella koehlerae C-29 TaxID=1134510 RepID=A0A067W7C5_9HYPH|nr:hypothetical protein [Bartonella koehlerae]KEC55885.1 hypothetical protein O9A_00440 [Bartonella koehlerae C-29]